MPSEASNAGFQSALAPFMDHFLQEKRAVPPDWRFGLTKGGIRANQPSLGRFVAGCPTTDRNAVRRLSHRRSGSRQENSNWVRHSLHQSVELV
jgi:hypothetical protein